MAGPRQFDAQDFDYYSEAQMIDPLPMYEEFVARCPVGRSKAHGGFAFVSRFDSVKRVFSDYRNFSSENGIGLPPRPIKLYPVDLDPPQQTVFRRIINRHYSPDAAERSREKATRLVHELIDEVIERGHADITQEITQPLLPPIILPVIGLPVEDLPMFAGWVEHIMRKRVSDPVGTAKAADKMLAYVTSVVAARRKDAARDDTMGSLIAASFRGRALDDDEVARTLLIIVNGGLDTTSTASSEALLYLARHPHLREQLASGEADWGMAIEEFLRLHSPAIVVGRTTTADTELDGETLRAGEFVHAMPGAANRDPRKFERPAECRLDRWPNDHLTFGNGAHVCLGRHFARMEMEVILKAVLERMPDYRPAPGYRPAIAAFTARAVTSFPVEFTPGARRAGGKS